jgi:hypothetical protein
MAIRDDYLLRYVLLIRQAIAQALKLRQAGQPDHALRVLLNAQEKLFARPLASVTGLGLDEQLSLLAAGENAATAREKHHAYAALLREAGLVYLDRDRPELAIGAFQLALQVMLTVVVASPAPAEEQLDLMRDLLARIPPEMLHAPVKELLAEVGSKASPAT